jgi:hypothetical protein
MDIFQLLANTAGAIDTFTVPPKRTRHGKRDSGLSRSDSQFRYSQLDREWRRTGRMVGRSTTAADSVDEVETGWMQQHDGGVVPATATESAFLPR